MLTGMDKETVRLLVDLHKSTSRQGPGSNISTNLAAQLAGLDTEVPLTIADIGCGTGASTLTLAKSLNVHITAVDMFEEFLTVLTDQAEQANVTDQITTLTADMSKLPFTDEQFDVMWAEGSIYNIGFERGIEEWRRFLKPKGILAVSEITWLSANVPDELRSYWEKEYPEIATAGEKIPQLEEHGYTPVGYFVLDSHCWLDEYYTPLEAGFANFLERHQHGEFAKEIVAETEKEIAFYKKYQDYYSYGMYIAKKG